MATDRVISDMLIQGADLTFLDWQQKMNKGGPVGYSDFRVFIPGDHSYQKAVLWGQLSASGGNQPRMLSLELEIDLPDITDRGSGTTSASGLVTVSFNRVFHFPPEVNATQKGGSVVATERISNITTTGFDIEFVNTSNGRVAVSFSWAAKGY